MTALILGILGLTILPGVGSIAAILVGRRNPYDQLSRIGVILGWVGVVLFVLSCCVAAVFGALSGLPGEFALPEEPAKPITAFASPTPVPTAASSDEMGYLGVRCEDAQGARVTGVIPGSPAEIAGLQPGDVIVRLDRETIRDCYDLSRAVWNRPGANVKLEIQRGNRTITTAVTLGRR